MINITDEKTSIFVKAFRSFLRAEGKMKIDQIINLYIDMQPSLHKNAGSTEIDMEAFMYSFLRLPTEIHSVQKIILSQTDDIFIREGYTIESWEEVSASARRRKMYFDKNGKLAVFINSVTDLDDIVCLLTAYQIEWNKMHTLLKEKKSHSIEQSVRSLGISLENWNRIKRIWGDKSEYWLQMIASKQIQFEVILLRGSYVDYKKAAQRWLENILEHTRYKDIRSRPLYFVSSNTHSLVNNMTGWVHKLEQELIDFLKQKHMTQFLEYWKLIETGEHPGSKENFLWYILKKYEAVHPEIKKKRQEYEKNLGIDFIEAEHYLDINAQVISLKDLSSKGLEKKLEGSVGVLKNSEGLVLNIDYPLGAGAYMVLSTILQNVTNLKGIYILGKASFLHANLGDIALPNNVYDTYSGNSFIFSNAFNKNYFEEFKSGSILTNQKAVSSKGTLLHPLETVQEYFKNDYTIIEMENGPYLNAIYEMVHFHRYPIEETVSMLNPPLDIGIIHYASDTPFTKAVTLGTRNLGYEGVEATYVSSLTILKRIIEVESR